MFARNLPLAECVLHIGCEKTGTSSIQRFLSVNRPRWKKEGVLYPVCGGSLYGGSQWGFAAVARDEPWTTDMGRYLGIASLEDQKVYSEKLREELVSEITKHRQIKRMIVSSEHFHSRLRSKAEISRLRDFFAPLCENFRIIMNFRRQDRVAVSLYATHLKSGNPSPQPFLPALELPETYYFRYDEVFQNWAEVFGSESIRPSIFGSSQPTTNSIFQDFCTMANLNLQGKILPDSQNASFSPAASRFLMEINKQWQDHSLGPEYFDRTLLIKELERLLPGKTFPFDRSTAIGFYQQFQETNQRLAAAAFPYNSVPIFDEDFSDYPETVPPQPTSPGEIAGVSLEVIRSLLQQLEEKR
jgi:hypothetical protein